MRQTLLVFILFLIKKEIKTATLTGREFYNVIITCDMNESISPTDVTTVKNLSKNVSRILVKKCRSIPFAEVTDTLGMESSEIQKVLYLEQVQHLTANDLTGIDKNIQELFLNDVRSVPNDLFSTIPTLETLYIKYKVFEGLSDFSYLSHLQSLTLLFEMNSGVLIPCASLFTKIMHQTSNTLKSLFLTVMNYNCASKTEWHLTAELFNQKVSLETVEFWGCVETVENDTFAKLENLTTLKIPRYKLKEFNPDFLTPKLNFLDFYMNELKEFILNRKYPNLTYLILMDNQIEAFTLDFTKLPVLEFLDLSFNRLKHFNLISSDHPNPLKRLDLESNKIRTPHVWQWAYENRNLTKTILYQGYPLCDCATVEIFEDLNRKWTILYGPNVQNSEEIPYVSLCHADVKDKLFYLKLTELPCSSDNKELQKKNQEAGVCDSYIGLMPGKLRKKILTFDCSKIKTHQVRKQILESIPSNDLFWNVGANDLHLIFQNNPFVTTLPNLTGVIDKHSEVHTFIYAENSSISTIQRENLPDRLSGLRLANNSIQEINVQVLNRLLELQTNLTLADNPFLCDCDHLEMYNKLISIQNFILDFDAMTCDDGSRFEPDRQLCVSPLNLFLYVFSPIVALLALILIFYMRNSLEVQVFIYSRGWFPSYFRPEPDDKEYEFDVFVSFSEKDQEIVLRILKLLEEDQNPPFKVCYHHRDWKVGERIDRQIIRSVEESRKTIIIVSQNFLDSHWANMEFVVAHYKMLEEKSPKLLLILHGEVDTSKLNEEIKSYIKTTTYLTSGDKWFEKKLLFSLKRPDIMKGEAGV